jgi:Holliday junction resolvase
MMENQTATLSPPLCPSCGKHYSPDILEIHHGLCGSCYHLTLGREGRDRCDICQAFILTTEESRRRRWRGKHVENDLVKYLRRYGWEVSGKTMPIPGLDGIASKPDRFVFLEAKHAKRLPKEELDKARAEVTGEQLRRIRDEAMKLFLNALSKHPDIKVEAVIAIKFPFRGFRFHLVTPEDYEKPFLVLYARDPDTWQP